MTKMIKLVKRKILKAIINMLKDLRGKLKFDEKRNEKYTSKIQIELE